MRRVAALILIFTFSHTSAFAQKKKSAPIKDLNIRELALPSEVEDINKKSGAVYYSPAVKGKVLMPVHFWGHLKNSGLHFIPISTNLINGISLAGGPNSDAQFEEIHVTTSRNGKREKLTFDISDGGDLTLEDFELKPGDTVFIPKDNFYQDRAYYTSLIGVIATIISSIFIIEQIKDT